MNEKNKTYNSEENEMEIPEVLKNVNKSSLFPVPEKYFDGLPSKIQERVFAKIKKVFGCGHSQVSFKSEF